MDLNQLLLWLTTGGSVIAISWICENWGLFQSLDAGKKRVAMWGSACVLGMGALAVTLYVPAETLALIAPFMKVVIANFGMIFGLELFHKLNKQPKG